MHSYAVTGPSSLPNIGRWRTGSGSQVLALNYGLPDPHQLDGPITTKALLNGVNHGFQCNAPAVIKEPLAQNKQSLHNRCGDIPRHAEFRVPDGEWGSVVHPTG
jgi:hypothetical protein